MKKLAFILCALAVIISFYVMNNRPIFSDFASAYEIYQYSNSSNALITSANNKSYLFIKNKTGESCKIYGDFSLEQFLNKFSARVVFYEKVNDGVSYYAYSSKIKYRQTVNGKTVNLQVFIGADSVTVGTPIIYGSY